MLSAAQLQAFLSAKGLRLDKRQGQHHLIDPHAIERIITAVGRPSSERIVEIGAGLGALTERLIHCGGRVVAVEVDRRFCMLLSERLRQSTEGAVEVLCQDILEFPWERYSDATVVGAIPYHITSPILISLCQARRFVSRAVLVVQREVGERLLAKPGTKAYGRLTILVGYCWDVKLLLRISSRAFFPPPKVDSICVELLGRQKAPVDVRDETWFFDVVKAGFAMRRKTLVKCLSEQKGLGVDRRQAQQVLETVGLPLTVRAEELSLEQFAALVNRLQDAKVREAKSLR